MIYDVVQRVKTARTIESMECKYSNARAHLKVIAGLVTSQKLLLLVNSEY